MISQTTTFLRLIVATMVLFAMTPTIVGAVEKYNVVKQDATNTNDEPSLDSPAIGEPISHGQIIEVHRALNSIHSDIESPIDKPYHLDDLLRGAQIYVAPPKPIAQPVCRKVSITAKA